LFGNLGAKPAEKEEGKKEEAPKAGGFSFGNLGGAKPAEPAAAAPASTSTGGGLFGAKPAEAKAPEAAKSVPAGSSLFGGAASTSTPSASAPAAPAAAPAPAQGSKDAPKAPAASEPAPNLLRGKTLEDIVDSWTKELDGSVKEFVRQAGEVREWDKVLVRTGSQVCHLLPKKLTGRLPTCTVK
jgi:nuclear pore complex protein Nup62